jgi:hypothetical protein
MWIRARSGAGANPTRRSRPPPTSFSSDRRSNKKDKYGQGRPAGPTSGHLRAHGTIGINLDARGGEHLRIKPDARKSNAWTVYGVTPTDTASARLAWTRGGSRVDDGHDCWNRGIAPIAAKRGEVKSDKTGIFYK